MAEKSFARYPSAARPLMGFESLPDDLVASADDGGELLVQTIAKFKTGDMRAMSLSELLTLMRHFGRYRFGTIPTVLMIKKGHCVNFSLEDANAFFKFIEDYPDTPYAEAYAGLRKAFDDIIGASDGTIAWATEPGFKRLYLTDALSVAACSPPLVAAIHRCLDLKDTVPYSMHLNCLTRVKAPWPAEFEEKWKSSVPGLYVDYALIWARETQRRREWEEKKEVFRKEMEAVVEKFINSDF